MGEVGSIPDLKDIREQLATIQAAMPTAAQDAPPAVADSSAKGTALLEYALGNHTHASKSRKVRITTGADGLYTWTFSPAFEEGVIPIVLAVAETASGVTDVINAQIEGAPSATTAKLRVTRTNRSTVALLGLTILSVPTSPGATVVHAIAVAP